MLAMRRQNAFLTVSLLLMWVVGTVTAERVKLSNLAEKLLYGKDKARVSAVEEFNKLSAQEQHALVPDFMVAMSDEDPNTRKIASRILKAMGVKVETEIPDARKEMKAEKDVKPTGSDKWAEEKRLKEEAGPDKWGDLKRMKQDEQGTYSGLKDELDREKNNATFLDATQLTSENADVLSPVGSVAASLRDPNPWVRAQAARRIGTLRPAPIEAIPDLIHMLNENIPESRRAAAAALGSFGTLAQEAVPALNSALSDPDPATREIAKEALKQIRAKP
jgi:hypothetical protein